MEDILYISEDKSLDIRLHFIAKRELRYSHLGKSWPKHTQCLLYVNGLLRCFETIVLHANDKDNPVFAYRKVAESCLKSINLRDVRSKIRIKLLKALEELEKEK